MVNAVNLCQAHPLSVTPQNVYVHIATLFVHFPNPFNNEHTANSPWYIMQRFSSSVFLLLPILFTAQDKNHKGGKNPRVCLLFNPSQQHQLEFDPKKGFENIHINYKGRFNFGKHLKCLEQQGGEHFLCSLYFLVVKNCKLIAVYCRHRLISFLPQAKALWVGRCKFIASKDCGCWLLIGKWLALNKWYSPLPEQLQESVRLNIFKSSMTWRLEIWIWWRVMSQMCSQTSRDGKPRRQCGSGRDDFFLLSGNQLLPPKAFLASCLLGSFERNGQLWHLYKIHSYICMPTNFMMLFVC